MITPMPEFLECHVTQEDIEYGLRDKPNHCAIAKALLKDTQFTSASVACTGIVIYTASHVGYYDIPRRAIEFIKEYDEGKHVAPATFVFVLEAYL